MKKGMKQVLVLWLVTVLLTSAIVWPGTPGVMAANVDIGQSIAANKWKDADGDALAAANGVIKIEDYAYLDEVLNAGTTDNHWGQEIYLRDEFITSGDVVSIDIRVAPKSTQNGVWNNGWNNFPFTVVLMDQKTNGIKTALSGIALNYQFAAYTTTAGRWIESGVRVNGTQQGNTKASAIDSAVILDNGWHTLTFKVATTADNATDRIYWQVFCDGVKILNYGTSAGSGDIGTLFKTGKFAIFASEWYDVYVKEPTDDDPRKLDIEGEWLDKNGEILSTVDSTTGVVKVDEFAYLNELGAVSTYANSAAFAGSSGYGHRDFADGKKAEFDVKVVPKAGAETARWSVGFTLLDSDPEKHPTAINNNTYGLAPDGTNDPALSFIYDNDYNYFKGTATQDNISMSSESLFPSAPALNDGNWHTIKIQAGINQGNETLVGVLFTVDGTLSKKELWINTGIWAYDFDHWFGGGGYFSVLANEHYDVYIRAAGSGGEYAAVNDGYVDVAQTIADNKWFDAQGHVIQGTNGAIEIDGFAYLNEIMKPGSFADNNVPAVFADGSVLEFYIKATPKQGQTDNAKWVFGLNQLDQDPLSHTLTVGDKLGTSGTDEDRGMPTGINSKAAITSFYAVKPSAQPRGLYTVPTLAGERYNNTGGYVPNELTSDPGLADGQWHTIRLTAALSSNSAVCGVVTSVDGQIVGRNIFWINDGTIGKYGNYKTTFENGGRFSINVNPNYTVSIRGASDVPGDLNADGTADNEDFVILKKALLKKYTLITPQVIAADIKQDGIIDVLDMLTLKNIFS